MFDVGWSELVVIGVVALVVIGPKELPGVIRAIGKAVGKLRTMAGEFRGQFDEAMREADLDDVKKTFTEASDAASSAMNSVTDPLSTIHDEVKGTVAGVKDDVGGVNQTSETLAAIEADAKALEAEAKAMEASEAKAMENPEAKAMENPEAKAVETSIPVEPAPKKTRKKAADDAGDAA